MFIFSTLSPPMVILNLCLPVRNVKTSKTQKPVVKYLLGRNSPGSVVGISSLLLQSRHIWLHIPRFLFKKTGCLDSLLRETLRKTAKSHISAHVLFTHLWRMRDSLRPGTHIGLWPPMGGIKKNLASWTDFVLTVGCFLHFRFSRFVYHLWNNSSVLWLPVIKVADCMAWKGASTPRCPETWCSCHTLPGVCVALVSGCYVPHPCCENIKFSFH